MSFTLSFNGKTENGKVYCESTRKSITQHFRDNVRPELAKVMGWREDKLRLFNSCQQEACFDVRTGHLPGEPWQEPAGCKASVNYEDI